MQDLPAVNLSWDLVPPALEEPSTVAETPTPLPPRRRWLRPQRLVSFVVVAGTMTFVFVQCRPGLLFAPTLDVGGDNAAHVVAVYYFIHDLLPRGQLAGWDPQWFNGFPLYIFYFPLPAMIVGFLSWFSPYAVAFKLVSVLGSVTLPLAAYVFGRGTGLRRPVPELMAVATLPFLFNISYTIDGGNLVSTMAGEFSYSLALTFGLLFLGTLGFAFRTGRLRWLAAIFFGATVLCHVVPALYVGGVAIALGAMYHNRRALRVLFSVGVSGGLLVAFWLLPFGAYLRYSSSMGYTRVTGVFSAIFPLNGELALPVLALVGCIFGVIHRERVVLALAISAIGVVVLFQYAPNGLVYNARWLPFWFLTIALLAAYGLASSARWLFAKIGLRELHAIITPLVVGVLTVGVIASWLGVLPFANWPVAERNFTDSWIAWNYTGYQEKQGWPEYEQLIGMLDSVTKQYGCGRLDYEYSPNVQNYFGSTLVEMAFPLFTNGCVQSAEGLYYESSTSTPFHFLDQSELSIQASNPVVGIPYEGLDVADGIRHLQLQGIKYFLANSPTVEQSALQDRDLQEIASIPVTPSIIDGVGSSSSTAPSSAKWVVYLIKSSPLVTGLSYQPVVESGMPKDASLTAAIAWYQNERYWPVEITSSGPSTWQHPISGILVAPNTAIATPKTTVSDITTTTESLAFNVSRIGTPVLVKVPYFPNWHASGALGPFEATPNLMVVVPTSRHVELHYGTTTIDVVGKFGTGLGLLDVLVLGWADFTTRRKDEAEDNPDYEPVDSPDLEQAVQDTSFEDDQSRALGGVLSEPT